MIHRAPIDKCAVLIRSRLARLEDFARRNDGKDARHRSHSAHELERARLAATVISDFAEWIAADLLLSPTTEERLIAACKQPASPLRRAIDQFRAAAFDVEYADHAAALANDDPREPIADGFTN